MLQSATRRQSRSSSLQSMIQRFDRVHHSKVVILMNLQKLYTWNTVPYKRILESCWHVILLAITVAKTHHAEKVVNCATEKDVWRSWKTQRPKPSDHLMEMYLHTASKKAKNYKVRSNTRLYLHPSCYIKDYFLHLHSMLALDIYWRVLSRPKTGTAQWDTGLKISQPFVHS